MGDTNKEEKYKIISYPAIELPKELLPLIIAPFLNSLRYGNDLFKLIDQEAYYEAYKRYIDSLLSRTFSVVRLAQLDDDTMLGWSLSENKTVHYVWVKKEARRQGIGKSLLPQDFDTMTHVTRVVLNIWPTKFPQVRLNPFI